jgi:CheY-like chemotaxis protein
MPTPPQWQKAPTPPPADEGWEGVHEQPTLPCLASPDASHDESAVERTRRALVLIVDDNRDSRDLYAEYLMSAMGCRVLTAEDGVQGLRLARTCLPDVILLDISMPVMDGCEMAQHLRAGERASATPIIAMTSFGGAWHEAARASGCTRVLSKPTCLPELEAAVRQALA